MNASEHFLVSCRPCGRVWSIMTVPIELSAAARLMRTARCPRCGSKSSEHFMATAEQAAAWERDPMGAARD